MITNHKILFISFFLYFIIVRKSIRTVMKENDEINGNKEISFSSSKKSDLLIIVILDVWMELADLEYVPNG
jgi:hypothetical protein